ncbi:hypothetical protein [Methylococcus geothermalis]|uniref:Uncharacterized protein n=1 Tax=Methylococcus geothermalis TaxID=2681310 RepID=A0A858Q4W1_9GAMM|nr:hypothetical protein [Methylococcus geothermalis]QJD28855.1 hypothetical protein GNH96_02000 [Methylococcus geothermalis]
MSHHAQNFLGGLFLTLAFTLDPSQPACAGEFLDKFDDHGQMLEEYRARGEAISRDYIKQLNDISERSRQRIQPLLAPPISIHPTYPGTSVPDYGPPGYVLKPNLGGGAILYRTYPGTNVPDISAPGYSIGR